MLSSPTNMKCPHYNKYSVDKIVRNNPINYEIEETFVCTSCGRQIDVNELYQTDSAKSTSSADKYCQYCNTKMEPFGDKWLTCPHCHYGYMDYIGDLPKELTEEEIEQAQKMFESNLYIHNDGLAVGKINEDLLSNTLQFDRCEKIIFRDKTLDFVFEIPDERYKDIDTIIVNGHKFVREN